MNTRPNQSPEDSLEPRGDFATTLRDFRSAVHHVAERETSKPVPSGWLISARHRQRIAQRRLVLAWTCAALLCVSLLPILHHAKLVTSQPVAVVQNVANDAEDTALLEQVDNAVSESVPSSLAPLATLDSWSSTTSTNESVTESSLNKPEKKNVAR